MGIEGVKSWVKSQPKVMEGVSQKIQSIPIIIRQKIFSISKRQKANPEQSPSRAEIIQEFVNKTRNTSSSEMSTKKAIDHISKEIKSADVPEEDKEAFKDQMTGVGG